MTLSLVLKQLREELQLQQKELAELHELQQQLHQQQEALNCAAQFAGMQVIQYDVQKILHRL